MPMSNLIGRTMSLTYRESTIYEYNIVITRGMIDWLDEQGYSFTEEGLISYIEDDRDVSICDGADIPVHISEKNTENILAEFTE